MKERARVMPLAAAPGRLSLHLHNAGGTYAESMPDAL